MKTVIRTIFVTFLLLIASQIPSHRVVPNLSAANPPLPRLTATEQEVKGFFDQYVDRYNRRDVEEFLSLFSLRAKQNQRDGLPEIRIIYTNLFNRSRSLQLSIEDMKIEIYQNAVEIRGRYTVDQVLKEGGAKRFWKGEGRWILIKEEEKLQILSVDYEISVPPTLAEERMPEPAPLLATEEEVDQFFSSYVDRYNQKDVSGFLTFCSSEAVHSQSG